MRKALALLVVVAAVPAAGQDGRPAGGAGVRRLPVEVYVDKMKAGWVGQMAGVGWGGPTEFRCKGEIIPAERMPKWQPRMVNQFGQDDIYVEMTFLRTLETRGWDCTIRQAGIDFANSGYRLWHANNAGRGNLRQGIAPPDSGHPQFNRHADDIDYQIEADYAGLIAPGMPQTAIDLGEKFGRLMNYGDGLWAGQFVGAMYAEAFFESDRVRIIQAALKAIPPQSQYAEMVRDVLKWYAAAPDDWEKTWQLIEDKYHKDPRYTHGLCSRAGGKGGFSIDAKLNGAYILMGLLYGKGDPDQTIVIATRCGQDSDCNPANAGGILFTTIGFAKLPDRFTSAIDPKGKFSHTPYDFPTLIEVSKTLVRQAVRRGGGRIETDASGAEVFVIAVVEPKPGKFEPSYHPGPPADSKFTPEEMKQIQAATPARRAAVGSAPKVDISAAVEKFAPGWKIDNCGGDMSPGLKDEMLGRKNVLVTHPLSTSVPCTLSRKVDLPAGAKAALKLTVGHHPQGDWVLLVKADGKELLRKTVGKAAAKDGWLTVTVDLGDHAGKSVALELSNAANNWACEAAYWAEIAIDSP